jgi:hypothetical protein
MNDGLITRIGKWMDRKWAAKATWLDVQEQETKCSNRHIGLLSVTAELEKTVSSLSTTNGMFDTLIGSQQKRIEVLEKSAKAMVAVIDEIDKRLASIPKDDLAKEVATLKTRLEQLEIYTNMSRKVDPTKPAVAKSAFAM